MHYFIIGMALCPVEAINKHNYLKNNSAYTVALNCQHVLHVGSILLIFSGFNQSQHTPHKEIPMI